MKYVIRRTRMKTPLESSTPLLLEQFCEGMLLEQVGERC